jgi:formate dehydrogenase subunit delta
MSPDKLAYMANQIGRFFSHKPHDQAVAGIRDHLTQFWEPRMRNEIIANLDNAALNLDPLVREAVEGLRAPRPSSSG